LEYYEINIFRNNGVAMYKNFTIEISYFDGHRKGQIITWQNIPDNELVECLGELTRDQVSNAHIYVLYENKRIQFEDYLFQTFTEKKIKN
jgi:hypothetical protein